MIVPSGLYTLFKEHFLAQKYQVKVQCIEYVKNSSRSLQFRTSTRDIVEEKGLFLQKQPRPERKLCLNKTETLRI